jgi:hypothetical protein
MLFWSENDDDRGICAFFATKPQTQRTYRTHGYATCNLESGSQSEPSASDTLSAAASGRKKSQQRPPRSSKGDEGTLVVYQANAGVADEVRVCQAFQSVRSALCCQK